MKAYSFDYQGLMIGVIDCDLCQITELKKLEQQARELKEGEEPIESLPLLPAYSTLKAPPSFSEDQQARFDGENWVVEKVIIPEPIPEPKPYVLTYADKRAAEYPSPNDYLDGVVKSHSKDQAMHEEGVAQIEKYIQDCLAVKVKYPKPKKLV